MKPMNVKELSAKLKEEKRAKIMAAKPSFTTKDRVQKNGQIARPRLCTEGRGLTVIGFDSERNFDDLEHYQNQPQHHK